MKHIFCKYLIINNLRKQKRRVLSPPPLLGAQEVQPWGVNPLSLFKRGYRPEKSEKRGYQPPTSLALTPHMCRVWLRFCHGCGAAPRARTLLRQVKMYPKHYSLRQVKMYLKVCCFLAAFWGGCSGFCSGIWKRGGLAPLPEGRGGLY